MAEVTPAMVRWRRLSISGGTGTSAVRGARGWMPGDAAVVVVADAPWPGRAREALVALLTDALREA